jgi:hypothetical protein
MRRIVEEERIDVLGAVYGSSTVGGLEIEINPRSLETQREP